MKGTIIYWGLLSAPVIAVGYAGGPLYELTGALRGGIGDRRNDKSDPPASGINLLRIITKRQFRTQQLVLIKYP
jgi:hypothetical protein